MFSVVGMMPITLSGSFISATAFMVPSTLPAPHMSYFISSISAPGLSEMPPVSKVTPLPTSTTGFCFFGPPLMLDHDELRRLALPSATDSSEPMPSFSMSLRSSTVTFRW